MKVVLFCGGQGLRMRGAAAGAGAAAALPKPLVPIGRRPLLWHVMRYYAHWGHKDFVLCLGHGGEAIKRYFLEGEDWRSNDFVLTPGSKEPALLGRGDTHDWRIAFVETGSGANIGERLLAVRPHLRNEEMFLANHADALTDYPLPQLIEDAAQRCAVGAFLAVRPPLGGARLVEQDEDGTVRGFRPVEETALRTGGGFFVFGRDVFEYIRPGEDLEREPFARLAGMRLLVAHRYDGFWRCCDTAKDVAALEKMQARGPAPWELWRRFPAGDGPAAPQDWLPAPLLVRPAAEPEALGR